ncbi:MAG: DUF2283 domain-containing protein [Gammaproteobacteria bacterium]
MNVNSFQSTVTLYIESRAGDIAETSDLDENTTRDPDARGNVRAMTFEHASERTDIDHRVIEGITAYRRASQSVQ